MDHRFPDSDLFFLIETAMPGRDDVEPVAALIRDDADFIDALMGNQKVLDRLTGDEGILLRVSPRLFFAALLRKARQDLEAEAYTMERRQRQQVAIFDAPQAARLLADRTVRDYLAEMLASFTRVQSSSRSTQVRKGVWHKQRFSELDIDTLIRRSNAMGKERRFAIYKRIADVCLFLVSMFPEYIESQQRYPLSRSQRSLEDYEREGRAFYGLAAGHEAAREAQLSEALRVLAENFTLAGKPLSFVSGRYLHAKKHTLFDL